MRRSINKKFWKDKKGANALMTFFQAIVLVQLFYSFSITTLSYALGVEGESFPELSLVNLDEGTTDLASISDDIQSSLEVQTDIPVVELGSLVFYSGNIIIDLLLNFIFAIPQMITTAFLIVAYFANVDAYIWAQVQLVLFVLVTVSYLISIISLLTSMRSGGANLA